MLEMRTSFGSSLASSSAATDKPHEAGKAAHGGGAPIAANAGGDAAAGSFATDGDGDDEDDDARSVASTASAGSRGSAAWLGLSDPFDMYMAELSANVAEIITAEMFEET